MKLTITIIIIKKKFIYTYSYKITFSNITKTH